jgi:hypothetical protein
MAERPGIFISYRREDASGHAGRLYDRLSERFGKDRLFMDVDTLELGLDWVEAIEKAIGSAGALLAVIGRSWVRVEDEDGRRRLDDPNDFVRIEIAGALERNIRVIPVLVQGANMPTKEELPDPLKGLTRRSALELRDTSWEYGVTKLAGVLEQFFHQEEPEQEPKPEPEPEPPTPSPAPVSVPGPGRPGTTALVGLGGSILLLVGLLLLHKVYLNPHFPSMPVPSGLLTAPAPLAVLAGCVLTSLVIGAKGVRTGWLAVGLLAGFGFEAAVKGLSSYGLPHAHGQENGGALLWLFGGLVVLAGVAVSMTPVRERLGGLREYGAVPLLMPLVLIVAAVLMVVGAAIPFNIASPGGKRTVIHLDALGVEPIATAAAVVLAAVLLYAGYRPLVAGVLLAFGIAGTLLWMRYVGIPGLQWVEDRSRASPRAGGLVGGAGAFLVLLCGLRLVSRQAAAPTAYPLPAA